MTTPRTIVTPHATVVTDFNFTELQIKLTEGPLDIMDVKEIYADFFRVYLEKRIEELPPDDVINLGYYVAKEYEGKRIAL